MDVTPYFSSLIHTQMVHALAHTHSHAPAHAHDTHKQSHTTHTHTFCFYQGPVLRAHTRHAHIVTHNAHTHTPSASLRSSAEGTHTTRTHSHTQRTHTHTPLLLLSGPVLRAHTQHAHTHPFCFSQGPVLKAAAWATAPPHKARRSRGAIAPQHRVVPVPGVAKAARATAAVHVGGMRVEVGVGTTHSAGQGRAQLRLLPRLRAGQGGRCRVLHLHARTAVCFTGGVGHACV